MKHGRSRNVESVRGALRVGDSLSFSSDDALREIQEAVNGVTGKNVPIARDTRMDCYFIEVSGADSLEYLDLSFRLEKSLGISLSRDDWEYLAGSLPGMSTEEWEAKFAPFFTFGRLADLVAERAKDYQVEPLTILGVTSRSAGAFRSIQKIAKRIRPTVPPFAPSTQIIERFRGRHLEKLWSRMQILAGDRIPKLNRPLPVRTFDVAGRFWGIGLVVVLLVAICGTIPLTMFEMSSPIGLIFGGVGFFGVGGALVLLVLGLAGAILYRTVKAIEPAESFLPHDIRTFRDLAELVAGVRAGWCPKCGYDLTGVESPRCPECGISRAGAIAIV